MYWVWCAGQQEAKEMCRDDEQDWMYMTSGVVQARGYGRERAAVRSCAQEEVVEGDSQLPGSYLAYFTVHDIIHPP